MESLFRISNALDNAIVWIGRIAAWAAMALMFVIVFDVVTRKFFVLGSTKLQEMEWHLHTLLFAFCLGYAYLKDAHVRIDLIRDRLSRRKKLWIELVGCLVFLIPYCIVVLHHGEDWWYRSFAINESSDSATGLPYRWIIKATIPLGFILLLLAAAVVAARKAIQLFGPEELGRAVDRAEAMEFEHLDEVKREEPEA